MSCLCLDLIVSDCLCAVILVSSIVLRMSLLFLEIDCSYPSRGFGKYTHTHTNKDIEETFLTQNTADQNNLT